MVKTNNKIKSKLFSLFMTAALLAALLAAPVSAEESRKEGVHAEKSTFEKNFSLSVAQKQYAIEKINRAVSIVTDPEMSDLEKYYRLALWENDHVTYDNEFWSGGYDFKYYRHQWDAYGALSDTSVCAGIAILYANLCHAADLPCKFVRTDPKLLDHTINYIPDINGNAYYIDVTEAGFFSSEKACAFGDLVDKDFAFITKPCDDGSFEYKEAMEYEDAVEHKEKMDSKKGEITFLSTSNIKECFKKTYAAWFKEYALHEGTTKEFAAKYVEKGSGLRATDPGYYHASYQDYPKQFSATEKPGIWFLEDFYRNPEEIRSKILNKEFDGQLLNIEGLEDSYDCANMGELQEIVSEEMNVEYFPSLKDGEIVAEENGLIDNKDYKVSVKSFDKSKGEAVIAIQGIGDYKGTYLHHIRLVSANPMEVKGRTAAVRYSKLRKKSQIIKRAKAIKVKEAKGKLTYQYVTAKKGKKSFKKYFKIGAKTGNIKVKKGLKKGTYRVKVKVRAAGNAAYRASTWKTVIFKIKVK